MAGFISIFNRYSIVKQLPVFSKLNWLELQKVARKSAIIEYKKGEIIRRQGDPPDALYCLVSGRVQGYTERGGHKQNMDFIRRGMHFGIVSLLTDDPHSMNYEAMNDSLVLKIDKKDFHQILADIPRLGIEFSHSLSRRVRSRTEKVKSAIESTIISIYSAVIGTGSSTYAVNLALSLARESKRKVIYVNITSERQPRAKGESGSEVGEAAPRWKKEAVKLNEVMDDYAKVRQNISSGELLIDVLNVKFDTHDTLLVNRISIFITELAHDYPYVVVDLPSEMDEVVLNTLVQSDIVQLITLDKKEDLLQTREVIDKLEELMKENFAAERVQVILSGRQLACYLSYEDVNRELDYDVYTKLPHIDRSQLNVAAVTANMSVITPHPDSDYARAVIRTARTISGVRVGLVLGGGAALGVAHIGVIRVLERENIPIDMVIGSSMGALVGAFWVTSRDASGLEELAREFQSSKGMAKLFDPVIPKSGLIGGRLIKRWLKTRGLGNKTFYSTRIPFKVVAYDLMHRQEHVIESGSLVDAVRKSIAIPGVIEPVTEKDQLIIDGGVLNPLPTNVPVSRGIKKVIAVNVLQSPEHVNQGYYLEQEELKALNQLRFVRNPWKYMQFKMSRGLVKAISPNIPDIIVRSLQASEYIIAEQSARQADVLIHPDLTGINWYELYKVDELIKSGEEAALKALPAIKELVKE